MASLICRCSLLSALQIARHERDFAAHLGVAAKPFEGDERKPKAIENESDDLGPLLVHSILDATRATAERLGGRCAQFFRPYDGPQSEARVQRGADLAAHESWLLGDALVEMQDRV
jgi:hypothetical protein